MAVPLYESRENLNALPGARVRNDADANAFGAGVVRAGQGFLDAGIAKIQEFEYAEALEAANQFQREVDDLHLNTATGLYNTRKRGAAMNMAQDADNTMIELAAKYQKKMRSPLMRNSFAEQARRVLFAQGRANRKWETAEVEAYQNEEAEGAKANAFNKISLYFDDDERVEVERRNILDALEYQLRNAGPEAREAAMAEMESNVAAVRLNQIVQKSPLEAEGWLEAHKESFSPDAYRKIKGSVEKMVEPYRVEAIRDELLSKFDDEGSALAYIRDNFEGDMEAKVKSAVTASFSDARRVESQREADGYDAMRNIIASAGSYGGALSAISRSGLSARHRKALERQVASQFGLPGAGSVRTDPNAFIDAKGEALAFQNKSRGMSVEERQDAAKQFISKYAGKIAPGVLTDLSDLFMRRASVSGRASGNDPYNKFSWSTRVNKMVRDTGIGEDADEEAAFWSAFSARAHEFETRHGREPTSEELVGIGTELTGSVVVEKKNTIIESAINGGLKGMGLDWRLDADEPVKVRGYKIPRGARYDEEYDRWLVETEDGKLAWYAAD